MSVSAIDVARQSAEWDPNPETTAQTLALIEAGNEAEIQKLFGSRLEFGTAGLRGVMGPGPNAMNDLTVIQAAQGLTVYLEKVFGDAGKARGVVLGYDHRAYGSLNSERFAVLSAVVLMSRGFTVHLFEGFVSTPTVPWAVNQLGAVAGVMVTASHNPKQDNGYKVYWDNGCQLISPHDKGVWQGILANLAPWDKAACAFATPTTVRANPLCKDPTETVLSSYIARLGSGYCRHREENASNKPIVYTAMHGVGLPFAQNAFAAFGLPPFIPVAEQVVPDPTFPTVTFPNPEEGKGALALSIATAEASGATLILANDPDADRLAVAEKLPDGTWKVFTGNEIGALLAHWEWVNWRKANPTADPSQVYMVASTVSFKMMGAIARKEGFHFVETLTGFKWIGNKAAELRAQGKIVLFSYEEAIGFCVGDIVKDKDGVSAAAVFAEMAGELARKGFTVAAHLNALYQTYGYVLTNNRYVFVDDPRKTVAIFTRLRNEGHYWMKLGRWSITAIRDLTGAGMDTEQAAYKPVFPTSSSSQMITYKFSNGAICTLRTSGTEPKLKWYAELEGVDPVATRLELDELVETIVHEMLQPDVHGLVRPKD